MAVSTQSLAERFRESRMVLDVPCGRGAFLDRLRELGVPCVGLDPDPDNVERCRASRHRTWVGDGSVLAYHRQKFDGIRAGATDASGPGLATMLHTLGEALLPGGQLVLTGGEPALEASAAKLSTALRIESTGADAVVLRRPARKSLRGEPVVGPYADAFVGCERVLDVGCGRGAFLDALRVRDVSGQGLEGDAELAEVARARGHTVDQAPVAALLAHSGGFDGIHLGGVLHRLGDRDRQTLLATARVALSRHGRVLFTIAEREAAAVKALCRTIGFAHVRGAPAPGPEKHRCVVATGSGLPTAAGDLQARAVALWIHTGDLPVNRPPESLYDLDRFERKVHSQGGEDGVLETIFSLVGTTNRYYVEFGCGNGIECNTAHLRGLGWRGLLMDGAPEGSVGDAVVHREWISAENINGLLHKYGVPGEPDLLSIDLDGNDYWVWKAIVHRPRVVVCEYNANLAADQSLAIPYDPEHRWDGSDHYGASLRALAGLGRKKSYRLVYCNQAGVNAFFVREDLAGDLPERPVEEIYRPPNYWYRGYRQFPDLGRTMVEV